MKDLEARAGELFLEAIELDGEDRERFLEGLAAEDAWLRQRVGQLLEADGSTHVQHLDSRSGLGGWAAGLLDGDSQHVDRDPERLGPFQIIRRLGVGGMGIVYEALQENPERSVALKILHPGGLRADVAKRFELEARVLGWLNHPGIAQIYSAGTSTSDGREIPYFAMELIEGEALHRYLKRVNPDRSARIQLVAEIADAVHHAHQKGVVHRDLKPSNILVTGEGRPKVLDFGVARLTDSDLQRSTLSTHAGEILGTISYMSPEQVRGDVEAVDTRSDVYALGVLLYEVLTGELPHKLRGVSIPKAARTLEEDEPTKPSAHDPRLAGDLETILLEALAKEPDRRYSSAEEFSSDLRRFLRHEPIVARTPSLAYQLLRFSQRHRAAAFASGLLLLVILSSAISSTVLLIQAREAESEALVESARANKEAASSKRVAALMVGLFEDADPDAPGGVSAQDLLDRGAERLEAGEQLEPAIRAELSDAIGRSYRGLARFEEAEKWVREGLTLRQELYPESSHPQGHPDLYKSLANMGSLEASLSMYEPALEKLEGAETMLIDLAGPFGPGSAPRAGEYELPLGAEGQASGFDLDFKDWLIVQSLYATAEQKAGQKAESLERVTRALDLASFWRHSPEWAESATQTHRTLTEMAAFLEMSSGKPEAAEKRLRGMVAEFDLGEGETLARASHLMDLGKAVELQGRAGEAIGHYMEARQIYEAIKGPTHVLLANAKLRMGDALFELNRFAEAEEEYRDALEIFRTSMSDQNESVATCLAHLSDLLGEEGRYEEFLEVRQQVLEIDVAIYGEKSSRVMEDLSDLAYYNANLGRLEESVALHERRLGIARELFGEVSEQTAFSLSSMAEFESALDNVERSIELFLQSLEIHDQLEGADPSAHSSVLAGYGWLLYEQEEFEAAIPPLQRALEMTLAIEEPAIEDLVTQQMALGVSLFEVGRREEAEPILREALAALEEVVGLDHPYTVLMTEYVEKLKYE